MTMRDAADVMLLRRVADRDSTAILELFDLHSPSLYGVATRILNNGAEADGILQQAFLHLWSGGEMRDSLSLHVNLIHIVRRFAFERLRLGRQMDSSRAIEKEEHLEVNVRKTEEDNSMQLYRLHEYQGAIESMPLLQRELIVSSCFNGYSIASLADIRKLPPSTITREIRSGMLFLRNRLQQSGEGEKSGMSSFYLEELAILNAFGMLEGEDLKELWRLSSHVTQEAKDEVAAYETIAALVTVALAGRRCPDRNVKIELATGMQSLRATNP